MEKVINLGIPHVGEKIFESSETDELITYFLVSETWKELAENVLLKRWKGWTYLACSSGKTEIVKLLLERIDDIDLKKRDIIGFSYHQLPTVNNSSIWIQLFTPFTGLL